MDNILSVRQLTERVRQLIEQRFPYIWVRGEVTNVKRPSSGHIYFSLKEDENHLPCVWFRGQKRIKEKFDPLTGEVWEDGPKISVAQTLENGQVIICSGRLTVYGPHGNYQLIVDLAQACGEGQWHTAFETLKKKLAALGYFAQERKRMIPRNPRRVALITSPNGAAIRDFIRVSTERGLPAQIRVYPSQVQGTEAPSSLIAALKKANSETWAELIVIIRGGGSIQDLWAFNDEGLATAIFGSPLPVLTGVGHEIDHSIADFVADLSAATPSHAAQLIWSERSGLAQQLDELEIHLDSTWQRLMAKTETSLNYLERHLAVLSPQNTLNRQTERLSDIKYRLQAAMENILLEKTNNWSTAYSALRRYGQSQEFTASVNKIDQYELRLQGSLRQRVATEERRLDRLREQVAHLGQNQMHTLEYQFNTLETGLNGLNPYAPLERGYSIVRDQNGKFVRSVMDVHNEEKLDILVRDGSFSARAEKPKEAR